MALFSAGSLLMFARSKGRGRPTEARIERVKRWQRVHWLRSPPKNGFLGRAKDLPSDFAENHDHYIRGAAKKRRVEYSRTPNISSLC